MIRPTALLAALALLTGCMTGNYKGLDDQMSTSSLESRLGSMFPIGTPREHVAAELHRHGVHHHQDWERDYFGDLADRLPAGRTPGDYLGVNTLATTLPIAWWLPEAGWNAPPKHLIVFTFDDDGRLESFEVFSTADAPEEPIRKVEA